MTIAGVEPVERVYVFDDVFGSPLEDWLKAEKDYYTEEQVRDILIKFAESVSVSEDIDYNWEEEPELVGFSLMMGGLAMDDDEGINEVVDEFMKKGE
ncbi:hypothetical protein NBT14_04275 [Weissella paramesenteroides]|uniref:hypothetical protein n=1 Tax=Weissella paramesenteroides TaxID=1249 RepID=UPI003857571D